MFDTIKYFFSEIGKLVVVVIIAAFVGGFVLGIYGVASMDKAVRDKPTLDECIEYFPDRSDKVVGVYDAVIKESQKTADNLTQSKRDTQDSQVKTVGVPDTSLPAFEEAPIFENTSSN